MLFIPLQPVPFQRITVTLAGQPCAIAVRQRSTGLFLDLAVSGADIINGVIARDRNLIVRDAYLGFIGDLTFYDTKGFSDPDHTGLGTRFVLLYLTPGEA